MRYVRYTFNMFRCARLLINLPPAEAMVLNLPSCFFIVAKLLKILILHKYE